MKFVKYLPLFLFVIGLGFIIKPSFYYSKGLLAQSLLDDAWNESRKSGRPIKAWSWADTYPIGKIIIPSLDFSSIILKGEIVEALAFGPAHIEGTSKLGEQGNIGIAGHRDSFFRKLEKIQNGDFISIEDLEGSHIYNVTQISIVEKNDTQWLHSTHFDCLTLVTCYPFSISGNAPQRFIVRAESVYEK